MKRPTIALAVSLFVLFVESGATDGKSRADNDCFDAKGEFLHTGPCLDGKKWRRWCDQVRFIAKSERHCAWPEEGGNDGFFWNHYIRGSSPLEAWSDFKKNLGVTYTIECHE